MMIAIHIHFSI